MAGSKQLFHSFLKNIYNWQNPKKNKRHFSSSRHVLKVWIFLGCILCNWTISVIAIAYHKRLQSTLIYFKLFKRAVVRLHNSLIYRKLTTMVKQYRLVNIFHLPDVLQIKFNKTETTFVKTYFQCNMNASFPHQPTN